LKSSREELRALVAGLSALREEDRTQMAREVHDVLGQALTGLKMDASWLDKRLAAGEIEPLAPLRERTGSLLANIDTTIKSVQRIASELRPPILDDFGLEAAVEWQVHVFQERTGLECDCLSSLGPVSIARERATAVFRILQEALTNVVRHSEAKRVGVLLEENKGYVVLEVRDNGRGFSPGLQKASKSLGLLGMRERALQVGGHLTIEGVPGGGTILTARIPLHSTPESLDGSERAANLTEVAA